MRTMTLTRWAVLASLAACGTAEGPIGLDSSGGGPSFAKNPPPIATTWVVDDLAGIASDGRGGYLHGECGVRAEVYPIAAGNGTMRPADSRSRCGYIRSVAVNIGTGPLAATGLGAIGLGDVAAGGTAPIDFNINTGTASCARLVYDAATGARVQASAAVNGFGKRTWLIESVAPHSAGCLRSIQNNWVWDGVAHAVPLRISITER